MDIKLIDVLSCYELLIKVSFFGYIGSLQKRMLRVEDERERGEDRQSFFKEVGFELIFEGRRNLIGRGKEGEQFRGQQDQLQRCERLRVFQLGFSWQQGRWLEVMAREDVEDIFRGQTMGGIYVRIRNLNFILQLRGK